MMSSNTTSNTPTGPMRISLGANSYEVPVLDGSMYVPKEPAPRSVDVPHPSQADKVITPFTPGNRRKSAWWIAFSCYDPALPCNANIAVGYGQCCNICGETVAIGRTLSPANLAKHIQRNHREVYAELMPLWGVMESVDPQNANNTGKFIPPPPGRKRGPKGPRGPRKPKNEDATIDGIPLPGAGFNPATVPMGLAAAHLKRPPVRSYLSSQHRARCMRAVTRAVLKNDLPVSIVEEDEFQRMLATFAEAGSNRAPMSVTADMLQQDLSLVGREIKTNWKNLTKNRHVFGSMDHWTYRDGRTLEANSVQWIDNFALRRVDLDCREYESANGMSGLGGNVATLAVATKPEILHDRYLKTMTGGTAEGGWGLDLGRRVYSVEPNKTVMGQITTDTRSEMDGFGQLLEKYNYTDHAYCFDHSLDPVALIPFQASLFAREGAGAGSSGSDSVSGRQSGQGQQQQQDETVVVADGGKINVGKGLLAKCRKLVYLLSTSPQKNKDLKEAQRLLAIQHHQQQQLEKQQQQIQQLEEDGVEDAAAVLAAAPAPAPYRECDQKPKDAVQDVVIRWWSVYDMIERLLSLKPALEAMNNKERLKSNDGWELMLNDDEWALLKNTKLLLAPFKDAQVMLEGRNNAPPPNPRQPPPPIVTSSLVLYLLTGLEGELDNIVSNGLDEEEDWAILHYGVSESIIACVEKMKEAFTNRWGDLQKPFNLDGAQNDESQNDPDSGSSPPRKGVHPSFILAHALDPRFKNLECIEDDENKELVWTVILQEMIQARMQSLEARKQVSGAEEKQVSGAELPVAVKAEPGEPPAASALASASASDPSALATALDAVQGNGKKVAGAATMTTGKRQRSGMFSRHVIRRKTNASATDSAAVGMNAEVRRQCEVELLKYRKEADQIPIFMDEEACADLQDPLVWWKQNCDRYETIWLLAQYYLAIPASASRSERCYSAWRTLSSSSAIQQGDDGIVVATGLVENIEETFFLKRNLHLAA